MQFTRATAPAWDLAYRLCWRFWSITTRHWTARHRPGRADRHDGDQKGRAPGKQRAVIDDADGDALLERFHALGVLYFDHLEMGAQQLRREQQQGKQHQAAKDENGQLAAVLLQ